MIYIFKGNREPIILAEWNPVGLPGYCYILAHNGWFRMSAGRLEKLKWGDVEVPAAYRAYALLLSRTVSLLSPS